MMHVVCFTCPWATRDKLRAGPISTTNLYWKKQVQIYQDTYCKGHTRTALPGTCTSRGTGLETHQGRQQLHTGFDYCIWKAIKVRVRQQTRQKDRSRSWVAPPVWKKMQEPGLQHQLGQLSSEHAGDDSKHLHQLITEREEAWWHNPSPLGDISLIPASSPNKMQGLNQQRWQKIIILCFIAGVTVCFTTFV